MGQASLNVVDGTNGKENADQRGKAARRKAVRQRRRREKLALAREQERLAAERQREAEEHEAPGLASSTGTER